MKNTFRRLDCSMNSRFNRWVPVLYVCAIALLYFTSSGDRPRANEGIVADNVKVVVQSNSGINMRGPQSNSIADD